MKKVPSLALCLLLIMVPALLHPEEEKPGGLFSRGYALFLQGDLTPARQFFRKALDRGGLLGDYSLYFLGIISFSLGDLDGARRYELQLKKAFPRSVWVDHADLQLAKIAAEEKNYNGAIRELKALVARSSKDPISMEGLYLLGHTYEKRGDWNEAYTSFQRLRWTFPLSPWAASAKKEIQRLRREHPDLFGLREPGAILQEGELLSRERDFDEAEKLLIGLSDLTSQASLRLRALMALAQVYRKSHRSEDEAGVLKKILRLYPEGANAAAALNRLAQIYWNQGDNLRALTEFKRLRDRYPESPHVDFATLASARIYESLDRTDEAIRLYRKFPKRFPHSPLRHQAAWRLAWIHYLQGDYRRAHADFRSIATGRGSKRYTTGALFWQARTAEILGQADEAKRIYRGILNAPDEDYYMLLSARALRKMGEPFVSRKKPRKADSHLPLPPLSPLLSFHFSRAHALARLSLHRLAVMELDEIESHIPGKASRLWTALMREYARNHAFDRSVILANRLHQPSDRIKPFRYPLAYWEIIKKNARERNLDPYLILALIRQESLFDPEALSPASAFGLMQLLASTADQEAKRMGLATPPPEELFDPNLNIQLGSQHLKSLLQLYSNSVVKALAAYNAGKNAVDRWGREIPVRAEEEFVERIPYGETRLYVKLVLRNYLAYKKLYDHYP